MSATDRDQGAVAPQAAALDGMDALADFRTRFIGHDDPTIPAYLDGNSLGRPTTAARDRWSAFVEEQWGGRLIRGWDEGWFDAPLRLGDRIAALTLGAAPGQTIVGDSTTVSLYKCVRSALALRPDRDEIVVDRGNFPTDRYIAEAVAAETGAVLRWIDAPLGSGVSTDDVADVIGPRTAVVLLSHVAFRSGFIAEVPQITRSVHEAGGLVVWDLCHSVGVLPIELDAWNVDFAAGCTYKYLNGGPGSPAFLYVNNEHISQAHQPIQGWMGVRDSFAMVPQYEPAETIRRFVSGTPPISAMIGMDSMLDLIEEAGIPAIREKSVALTEFAVALYDERLAQLGVELSSPRSADVRGGHLTIDHPAFGELIGELWQEGVIPDFRPPSGIRLGLSPLSTSFAEVEIAIDRIAARLRDRLG